MQSINVVVLNPWFMTAFFGTAAACVLALIFSLLRWHEPGAAYLFAGGVLYLVGTLLVTIVFNVPRNEALAAVAPTDPNGASAVGRLCRQLDGLEPRSYGGGACRGGIVQHRARLLSESSRGVDSGPARSTMQ